jgi:hypothetical protein
MATPKALQRGEFGDAVVDGVGGQLGIAEHQPWRGGL